MILPLSSLSDFRISFCRFLDMHALGCDAVADFRSKVTSRDVGSVVIELADQSGGNQC